MRIEAYKLECKDVRVYCPECVMKLGFSMRQMTRICFDRHGTRSGSPGNTHNFTYGEMRFFLDMKWKVIELDDGFERLFSLGEQIFQNTCCVNIQTYPRRHKEVLGFCTRQARINGQIVCVLVLDPNIDLPGASDTGSMGTKSAERGHSSQGKRTGLGPGRSGDNGPGPKRKGLIPVDAGGPALVSTNDGLSVGTVRKADNWLLPKRV